MDNNNNNVYRLKEMLYMLKKKFCVRRLKYKRKNVRKKIDKEK